MRSLAASSVLLASLVGAAPVAAQSKPPMRSTPSPRTPTPTPTSPTLPAAPAEPTTPYHVTQLGPPLAAGEKLGDITIVDALPQGIILGKTEVNLAGGKHAIRLWLYRNGVYAPVGRPGDGLLTAYASDMNARGQVSGKTGGEAWVWDNGALLSIPKTLPPGREGYRMPSMSVSVLESGRIYGSSSATGPQGHSIHTSFLFEGGKFTWLGLTGREFEVPGTGAIQSSILGERPDGSIIGFSRFFRTQPRDGAFPEADGFWRGVCGWVYKDGKHTAFGPFTRDALGDPLAEPLQILKNGVVIVRLPGGLGRVKDATIEPIPLKDAEAGMEFSCPALSDDGRFLVISGRRPGAAGDRRRDALWLADGPKAVRIVPPDLKTLGGRPDRTDVLRLTEAGAVVLKSAREDSKQDHPVHIAWMWKDGKASLLRPLGQSPRAYTGTVAQLTRGSDPGFIAGGELVEIKIKGEKPRTVSRGWVYDLKKDTLTDLNYTPDPARPQWDVQPVAVTSDGAVFARCSPFSGQNGMIYRWTAAEGFRPLEVRPPDRPDGRGGRVTAILRLIDPAGDLMLVAASGLGSRKAYGDVDEYIMTR